MFSANTINPISRLYPNLIIRKVEPPSRRSISQDGSLNRSGSVGSTEKREQKPVLVPKPILKPEPVREPTPSKVEPPVKKVVIEEPKPEVIEEPKPTPKPEPKPKRTRPNRACGRVRDMLKGGPSQRDDPVPKDGEKGFQQKYTFEQRREQYLERLSRKSIKNAEKEVNQVLEVLDKVGHDPDKLKAEEREIKKRLSLINTAKYFTVNNINENTTKTLSGNVKNTTSNASSNKGDGKVSNTNTNDEASDQSSASSDSDSESGHD